MGEEDQWRMKSTSKPSVRLSLTPQVFLKRVQLRFLDNLKPPDWDAVHVQTVRLKLKDTKSAFIKKTLCALKQLNVAFAERERPLLVHVVIAGH